MKRYFFISILFLAACSGYKSTSAPPRTPEDVQIAEAASKLEDAAEALQHRAAEPLKSEMNDFVEATTRFNNNAQRFGPRSLRARDAFDKVRFQSVQLNANIEAGSEVFEDWKKIRTEQIDTIARKLGYRIE